MSVRDQGQEVISDEWRDDRAPCVIMSLINLFGEAGGQDRSSLHFSKIQFKYSIPYPKFKYQFEVQSIKS